MEGSCCTLIKKGMVQAVKISREDLQRIAADAVGDIDIQVVPTTNAGLPRLRIMDATTGEVFIDEMLATKILGD